MSMQHVCAAAAFAVGCALEVYTYKLNPPYSTGAGWGLLAAFIIMQGGSR
jgi:hypothetical protein